MDEIAKLCEDLAAAGFIEPMTWHRRAEAGTEPSCGSPQREGKDPCGDSGTGTSARGQTGGRGGSNRFWGLGDVGRSLSR